VVTKKARNAVLLVLALGVLGGGVDLYRHRNPREAFSTTHAHSRLRPVTVQLGLTDGADTEVLGENLTRGQRLALVP
jgi:hypothetical protein